LLVNRVAELVPAMQDRAARLDRDAAFPSEDIVALRAAGALAVSLPAEAQAPVEPLATVLTLAGTGNLSVGRVLEAHINARHLIARYGTPQQRRQPADALFGLWVTDPPGGGLRMQCAGGSIRLSGGKQFCSAVGHAMHAVVTAQDEVGAVRMLILRLTQGERVSPLPAPLAGMRAAVTGAVDFDGCEVDADASWASPVTTCANLTSPPAPGADRPLPWADWWRCWTPPSNSFVRLAGCSRLIRRRGLDMP